MNISIYYDENIESQVKLIRISQENALVIDRRTWEKNGALDFQSFESSQGNWEVLLFLGKILLSFQSQFRLLSWKFNTILFPRKKRIERKSGNLQSISTSFDFLFSPNFGVFFSNRFYQLENVKIIIKNVRSIVENWIENFFHSKEKNFIKKIPRENDFSRMCWKVERFQKWKSSLEVYACFEWGLKT